MLDIVVLALATWRWAAFLARLERGPFDVFEHARHWLGVRFTDDGTPYGTNSISDGALCLWCCSVWFGAAWAIVYAIGGGIAVILALPFALSTLAILLDEVIGDE